MVLISFAYSFFLGLSPHVHMCVYIYAHMDSLFIFTYAYEYMHTYFYVCLDMHMDREIWVSNNYYSLSIAQNKATTWFLFLFLSLCTFACVHVCINKNLVRAVIDHSHLQLNRMTPRVKRVVANPGGHPRPLRLLNINGIILKIKKKREKIFFGFHADKSLFSVSK